jgi:hypothetical protein
MPSVSIRGAKRAEGGSRNNRWAQLVAEGEVSSTVLIEGVAMPTANVPTARECRQRAQACLLLATTSVDFYAQDALIDLASDFENMADSLEQTKASNLEDHHLQD